MHWVYLSPHFDDVALSCGGLVWGQVRAGDAPEIWTICAGDIPPGELSRFAQQLHARWETGPDAVAQRKTEDLAACAILGASHRHFEIPDAIYRTSSDRQEHLYAGEEAIFSVLDPREEETITSLACQLMEKLPEDVQVVCPLALGDHVDHQLARAAAERTGLVLRYYPDYPYVIDHDTKLADLEKAGWQKTIYPLAPDALKAWVASIAAYRSQISSFWEDEKAMETAIADYFHHNHGICLWSSPKYSCVSKKMC